MAGRIKLPTGRAGALLAIIGGAVLLRLIGGVGFANYDTLYALGWGGQLARAQAPAYEIPVAPTPHPLVEALGALLEPLGPRAAAGVTVWLGLLALSACAWVVYALGSEWFGRPAGALAGLLILTRVPVLSYGVRAYVDVPYLLLVLSAVLVETRRPRAGAPVLMLLALAGLLRPEAWVFSALYWLYLLPGWKTTPRPSATTGEGARPGTPPASATAAWQGELLKLALLALSAPLVWLLSDLAVTGDPLWSLTNTRHTAQALGRVRGIANVPEYIPRRIGEILRPSVLAGGALGAALSLLWLRRAALSALAVAAVALVVFAVLAAAGLPINTRYAFLLAAIGCILCGAGALGWTRLRDDPARKRWWMLGGAIVVVALLAATPGQYRAADRELSKLARQQHIEGDLVALVKDGAISLRCGKVGVSNHAPIPLLALYLKTSPRNIVNAQLGRVQGRGVYVDPASREVERDYVLDPHDPVVPVSVPPGFREAGTNRSWLIFRRCA
ncbi:MAG: hypothetical protein E6G34_13940 [Actinobacteria bacterium]|nr:MAG: hypothetical protein E6G34_13940 [Actinomycetota bacterium]